jgi:Holliday junction DNA helicase RuvA
MIGQLRGAVAHKGERHVILDVAGVGYRVATTPETVKTLSLSETSTLLTHLAVRENALDLYGFRTARELEFFELLLTVSGVGPKSALAIISLAPPDVLEKAILGGDASYLTKVSGIGKKSAEKIVVELKDKLVALTPAGGPTLNSEAEAVEALQALGYSLPEARTALKNVAGDLDTGERVKQALKQLGK